MRADDIRDIASESGVVATLLVHPDYAFYSEHLQPKHFTSIENRFIYEAIVGLCEKGIEKVDAYNIISSLKSKYPDKREEDMVTVQIVNELINMTDSIARHTIEEYKLLVDNVVMSALRRELFNKLRQCESLCVSSQEPEIEQKIYSILDNTMLEFGTVNHIPQFKDVIDDVWERIVAGHGGDGASGIPFKFPTLNHYTTLEPGELFIFAAENKQGKSIMMLNCAYDLLCNGYKVLYIDSELSKKLFACRMLSHITGIEFRRVKSGDLSKEEFTALDAAREQLKQLPFTHVYMPMFDAQSIYTAVKKIRHTQGIDVLIIDYFKGSGEGDAFASYQELGRLVDMVKNKICGDMNIAGLGAAQATTAGRVADSAKISRNASTIAMLQDKSEEEIERDGAACGNKKIRVILNRNGMQHQDGEYIDVRFHGNTILFEEAQQHADIEQF